MSAGKKPWVQPNSRVSADFSGRCGVSFATAVGCAGWMLPKTPAPVSICLACAWITLNVVSCETDWNVSWNLKLWSFCLQVGGLQATTAHLRSMVVAELAAINGPPILMLIVMMTAGRWTWGHLPASGFMGHTMGVSSCVNHSCCDGVFSCLSLALLELQKCKPGALVIIALDCRSYTAMPLGPTYPASCVVFLD